MLFFKAVKSFLGSCKKEGVITPRQFYFPYFFKEMDFRRLISPFDLTTDVQLDPKMKRVSHMHLLKGDEIKVIINFRQQLMIENENLIIWSEEVDRLIINKVDLKFENSEAHLEIPFSSLDFGVNKVPNDLGFGSLITYVRFDKIRYRRPYYGTFAIVVISGDSIEVIPFDWLNERNLDFHYAWPAIAQVNEEGLLIGKGMRTGDFKVPFRKEVYNNI